MGVVAYKYTRCSIEGAMVLKEITEVSTEKAKWLINGSDKPPNDPLNCRP